LSYSSFEVSKTGIAPVLTPVNDSFVRVDYKDAFIIEDFSQVTEIEFYTGDEYFALASEEYNHIAFMDEYNRVVQPLVEGKQLLACMDPCQTYNSLYVRISGYDGHVDSIQFSNKPDEICEEESYSWICYEDNTITLSREKSDIFQIRNCIRKVEVLNETLPTELNEGENFNIMLENEKKAHLYLTFENSDIDIDIDIVSCREQNRRMILSNTSDWICVNGSNVISFFKTEWEDFNIHEVHYDKNEIKFGQNKVENIPKTLILELMITTGDSHVYAESIDDMITECDQYQLTNCLDESFDDTIQPSERAEDAISPYVIGIVSVLLVVVVVIITVVIITKYFRNKKVLDSQVSTDVNPTYGETAEYDGYYAETKFSDENEHYNKDGDEYIKSEIRDKNEVYE